jgi:hypothetical protein
MFYLLMAVWICRKKSLAPGEVDVDVKGGVVEQRLEGMEEWQVEPRRQWAGDDGLEGCCVQGCGIGARTIRTASEGSARLEAAKGRFKLP